MFAPIDQLPAGIVGFEAHGRISRADRHGTLTPCIESSLARGRKVKLLYVAGADFVGYDDDAPFDDAVFGTRNFTAFDRIAFVGDDSRFARAVDTLDGLMPAELRRFASRDLDLAKAWLAG